MRKHKEISIYICHNNGVNSLVISNGQFSKISIGFEKSTNKFLKTQNSVAINLLTKTKKIYSIMPTTS